MKLLFARYHFEEGSHALRELRGLVEEAQRRGHAVTLLTGELPLASRECSAFGVLHSDTPHPCAFPDGIDIRIVKGSRKSFVKEFQALSQSGEFERTLALEAISGAQFCVPDIPHVFPAPLEKCPDFFDTDYRQKWVQEQETFRSPSSTVVFCSGEIQKLTLRLHYGVIPGRICNVSPILDDMYHEGPDATEVALLRKSHGCEAADTLLVVTFAKDWQAAGVDRALATMAYMPQEWRNRIRFLVVGGNLPDGLERLQTSASELHFPSSQIQYLPDFNQPRLLLYGADLLLMPAREDNSGDLLADALACGLPVLCTASCSLSPFVQATGCSVVKNPFDDELFAEALAFCLPKLGLMRQMLTNRATLQLSGNRSQDILNRVERGPISDTPQLDTKLVQQLLVAHREQVAQGIAMKMDRKRNISRVQCPDGTTRIIKEFKRRHCWEGMRHPNRTLRGTELLRFFTPQCQAVVHEANSDCLVFGDCGKGNFYSNEYLILPNIRQLYTACGSVLAILHTAGIYHMDCKPANFVRNTDALADCAYPVCLVDCDNVQKMPLPLSWKKRIHNLAQFIAGTGNLARHDFRTWLRFIFAFQEGYIRHTIFTPDEWEKFWNQFWDFMSAAKHIEYTLPFNCAGDDLKKIRQSIH